MPLLIKPPLKEENSNKNVKKEVLKEDISKVIKSKVNIPVYEIDTESRKKLKGLEKYLDLDFATMARMAGYSEDTIKYGDDNLTVSYEKYDKLIQDYRREIEHAAFTVEQKRRNAKDAKEYLDDISKYLETLDNVPEDIKKKLKNIYTLLDYIDTKYDAFMIEK